MANLTLTAGAYRGVVIMITFCDDCLTEAYDHVGSDEDRQSDFLAAMGAMIDEHRCSRITTNGEILCDCTGHK